MTPQATNSTKRITQRQVAEHAGVSVATASYVLSGTEREGARTVV